MDGFTREEQKIYACIAARDAVKAREIANLTGLDRSLVNRHLYASPLLHELCWQDRDCCWHAMIRQGSPHRGLEEFSGWYGTVRDFLALTEEQWLASLTEGCVNIGRNLNDTRGLFHSFRDERETMRRLFADIRSLSTLDIGDWELVFELRIKRSRHIRIYTDVLLLTPLHCFSLEFKMKNKIDPEEVAQAFKYARFLGIILGEDMEIVPALVLTGATELFDYAPVPEQDAEVHVVSGDLLFNLPDTYLHFLG